MEVFSKNVVTTKTYTIRAYFGNIHKYITTHILILSNLNKFLDLSHYVLYYIQI